MAGVGSFYGGEDFGDELYSWKESIDFDAVSNIAVYVKTRLGVNYSFESDAFIPFDADATLILVAMMESNCTIHFYAKSDLYRNLSFKGDVHIPFDVSSDEFMGYPWVPEFPPGEEWTPVPPPVDGWAPVISAEGPWQPITITSNWQAAVHDHGPWIPVGPDRRPNG